MNGSIEAWLLDSRNPNSYYLSSNGDLSNPLGFGFDVVQSFFPMFTEDAVKNVNTASWSAETPVPAALPLFATGLGVLGLLGWRKRKR